MKFQLCDSETFLLDTPDPCSSRVHLVKPKSDSYLFDATLTIYIYIYLFIMYMSTLYFIITVDCDKSKFVLSIYFINNHIFGISKYLLILFGTQQL